MKGNVGDIPERQEDSDRKPGTRQVLAMSSDTVPVKFARFDLHTKYHVHFHSDN